MGRETRSKKKGQKEKLKITVVGDGMVGKTCLLITYTSKKFPQEYIPTVFDNYSGTLTTDKNQTYDITLWDTAGQEDYERLRPMSYPNTDCFILCYSISSKSSLENVLSKWYPELKFHCPKVPIILVATKADLRHTPPTETKDSHPTKDTQAKRDSSITDNHDDASNTCTLSRLTSRLHIKKHKTIELVSTSQGKKMARKIKADKYLECSALYNEGLDQVFLEAVRSGVKGQDRSCCVLL